MFSQRGRSAVSNVRVLSYNVKKYVPSAYARFFATSSRCVPTLAQWNGQGHSLLALSPGTSRWGDRGMGLYPLLCAAAAAIATAECARCEVQPGPKRAPVETEEMHELVNWSGTHTVETKRYYQPESLEELKDIVKNAHIRRQKLRPIGSALSPNGLGFEQEGMVNLVMMDEIIAIDAERKQVRLQAGARVSQVVEALRKHNLTLQNYASITEQQIGGFIQVGAHGTGALIPPVDEQVIGLKLITPAAGELDLSMSDDDPSLFQLARTALGLLGIVAEVTLQCVPAHQLIERTFVTTRAEVEKQHDALIRTNRHLRYMWIPHTDSVVVVTCNPLDEVVSIENLQNTQKYSDDDRLSAARRLLRNNSACKLTEAQINELSFTALRNELLSLDPLNVDWVRKVNLAELEFWKRSEGTRIDWSDRILQFDCGGQQWVSEVAFPVPQNDEQKTDLKFVGELLDLIEQESVPAHAPIEQRWSAPSMSPMSPAGEKPDKELGSMYSWVGIIMYMPDSSTALQTRQAITNAFHAYKTLCEKTLWDGVKAVEHWAKIEMPNNKEGEALLQSRTMEKYPVEGFLAVCGILDPHGILRNDLMSTILGAHVAQAAEKSGHAEQ